MNKNELTGYTLPTGSVESYKYVVVCSNYQGRWMFSRHKERTTWETQGGHVEPSETPMEAARRELYEESGVTNADLYAVCDYKGYRGTSFAYGRTFLAVVHKLGELPESEMEEVCLFDKLPHNLTYPKMTPVLIAEAEKFLKQLEMGK